MVAQSQTLRQDFLVFMKEREAIPKESTVVNWLRSRDEGVRTGSIGLLLACKRVPVEYAVKFVKYVLGRGEDDPKNPTYVALRDFLQLRTQVDVECSPQSIAASILEDDSQDSLQVGLRAFWDLVVSPFSVSKAAGLCKPRDVVQIMKWLYVVVGRNFVPTASVEEAIQIAEEKLRCSYEKYTQSAIAWHRFDPWTAIHAHHGKEAVGTTVVLPLKPEMYAAVRAGELEVFDIPPSALQRPSRYVLLKGCCERPYDLFGVAGNMTRQLNLALMRQIAVLSYMPEQVTPTPLHALSFGVTTLNERRLQTTGFQRVGTKCPLSKFPLYEYVLPANPADPLQCGIRALLHYIGDEGVSEIMRDKS